MEYNMDMGIYSGIFAVPSCIVDRYLKLANGPTLKVLLTLLRFSGEDIDVKKIAEIANLDKTEVIDGLNFWKEQQIIDEGKANAIIPNRTYTHDSVVIPIDEKRVEKKEEVAENENNVLVPIEKKSNIIMISNSVKRLNLTEATDRMAQSAEVDHLVKKTEEILDMRNNTALITGMVMLYDWINMSVDTLLMIVHFCKSIGILNMRGIEKICCEFADRGAETHEEVEKLIQSKSKSHKNQNAVRSVFGIGGRALSIAEKEFIDSWFFDLGYTIDFIDLAYNRTIDNIGEMRFKYTNQILVSWHEKGIKTIEEAQADVKEHTQEYAKDTTTNSKGSMTKIKPTARKYSNTSYDIKEIEHDMIYNTPKL